MRQNKTNYVIATYYDGEHYLEECCLLGWNNNEDWYSTDYYGSDIITEKGNLKRNSGGFIWITKHESITVGETYDECKRYCELGNKEGYECVVCKIELDSNNDWIVIPVKIENDPVSN